MPTAPGSRLRIEFAQASDPGRDPNKQINEDSCGYSETKFGHLCVLCDGMGGHYGGKEASRLAIATIFEMIEQAPPTTTPAEALKAAIEEAGRRVYRLGGPPENRQRPGSTAVAMLLHDRGVDVAHVGDSRAYVVRASQIYPLTRDHSMVQGMIDAGMLTEAQAIGHPDANKITRALGMKPEVEVEVRPEPMELFAGDLLLLASDGLTDLALAPDILGCIRQALASGTVESACHSLIRLANDRGGHDNITVQIVRVVETVKSLSTVPPVSTRTPGDAAPSSRRAPSAPGPTRAGAHHETLPMTAPDSGGTSQPYGQPISSGNAVVPSGADPRYAGVPIAPVAQVPPGGANAAWLPAPTAPDGGSPGVAPTMTDAMPPSARMPVPPAPGSPLAPYRLEANPGALPLPPPAAGYAAAAHHAGHAGHAGVPGAAPPHGAPPPHGVLHAGAPYDAAAAPMSPTTPMGPGYVAPAGVPYGLPPSSAAAPSRSGVVLLLVGVSAGIAILAVVLLWALFLR